MTLDAKEILEATRVPTTESGTQWNVFQVGCVSTPLNFASQQMRAFKLTWALDKEKLINGRKIAVVGAGLAGVTAGTVCLLKGAEQVSLYDRAHELMAFQHGALHRYVHPFIYCWPEQNANKTVTTFPILNWTAGTADEIRKHVVEQAESLLQACYDKREKERHDNDFQYRVGCDVRHLWPIDGKVQLLAEGPESKYVKARNEYLPVGPIRNYQDDYDVVIAAVGFGLESELPGVPFRSYWHLDTLSQPTIRGLWPKRWMVSGTGDGGLIDAIRLRLFDADQKVLTDVLTGNPPIIKDYKTPENWGDLMGSLQAALSKVEKEMCARYLGAEGPLDLQKKNEVSRAIHRAFSSLHDKHGETFETLKTFLESRERTDTVVYLNGQQEMPYELGASLFQRFLIYLLRRDCGLRYRWGKPRPLSMAERGGAYRFEFDRGEAGDLRMPTEQLEVDEVVIRHGAESALGGLFGSAAVKKARTNDALKRFDKSLWDEDLDPVWSAELTTPILPNKP